MNKKSIMIDMDDCIVSGGFLYLVNEYLKTNYTESDFDNFYMQEKIQDKEDFFKWFFTKNLYDYCHINDNAKEVIEQLNEEYDVYIGTSYLFKEAVNDSGIILKYKFDFLIDNFPFLDPYKFVFLGKKDVLNCDIKIDDSINNIRNAKTKILFSAYHNLGISDSELKKEGIIRADNWLKIKEILIDNK